MSSEVKKRADVTPERGEHEYGDVKFADPTNNKYPIDTPAHIRAAWSYIHHKDNAGKYEAGDAEKIKDRIRRAAKEQDIELHDES